MMTLRLPLGDGFGRLSFAGARNGDLPTVLAFINVKFFTPITSLVSQVSCHNVTTPRQLTCVTIRWLLIMTDHENEVLVIVSILYSAMYTFETELALSTKFTF